MQALSEGKAPPEEGHGALSGHSFGQQSLAGAWRPIKQQTRASQAQWEQLWMLQRELDGVQDLLFDLLQTAHILPLHWRDLPFTKQKP